MGTALRFNEEARAAFIAVLLLNKGHGVLWNNKKSPHVVMTSCCREECHRIIGTNPGTIESWFKLEAIDCGARR